MIFPVFALKNSVDPDALSSVGGGAVAGGISTSTSSRLWSCSRKLRASVVALEVSGDAILPSDVSFPLFFRFGPIDSTLTLPLESDRFFDPARFFPDLVAVLFSADRLLDRVVAVIHGFFHA